MESTSDRNDHLLSPWSKHVIKHPWRVLVVWVVLMASLGVAFRFDHGTFVNNFNLPGSEAQQAVDLLHERMPERAGDSATIVINTDAGLTTPEVRAEVEQIASEVKTIPGVVGIVPVYASGSGADAISKDGSTGFMLVQFSEQADAVPDSSVQALENIRATHDRSGFQVQLGGQVITAGEQSPPSKSEALGLIAAIIILLIAFGSIVAMGLPIITALTGLVTSLFLISLLALRFDFSTETRAFTAMIGIGVGIDYALFVVTRYRESLHDGESVEDAVFKAMNTAGRSILFAGSIVVVALLGLSTMGIPFVGALGIAAAIVVTMAVLVAFTALPALLAILGHNIDRWSIPGLRAAPASGRHSVWYRLADFTQRRPWSVTASALALLLLLAVPALDMRIGSSDAGNKPTSLTSRRAYDLLTEGFGAGFNGPLTLVVDTSKATDPTAVDRLITQIKDTPGVARVAPPLVNTAGDTAVIAVIPATSPQSEETEALVHALRNDVVAPTLESSGAFGYVGGPTAAFIDMGDRISDRLPMFFAIVIGVSALLLLIVFRSIVIPIQAAVFNLLSIGAAYGVLVAIFQWGWFAGLFGIDRTGPIESFLPMMLFAVLFGLSTDYEVFLVSRIHEEWLKTKDTRAAINHGSATTTRVISAAAAIMVVVFLSFTLSDARIVKEFGLGMATAVFIDATIIRMLLVPAVMGLFGSRNWYLPSWLDRRLPHVALEMPDATPVAIDTTNPATI